jgi:hypothetical protein
VSVYFQRSAASFPNPPERYRNPAPRVMKFRHPGVLWAAGLTLNKSLTGVVKLSCAMAAVDALRRGRCSAGFS